MSTQSSPTDDTSVTTTNGQSSMKILCRSCDYIVRQCQLPANVRALCPRCHTPLYDTPYGTFNTMLALCLSAIIFYIPANFFPVIYLEFFGSLRDATVIEGGLAALEQGYPIVGLAVIVAGVIAPGLLLVSILIQLLLLRQGLSSPMARNLFRQLLKVHQLLAQLSMLEIYLISLFVSAFQLSEHTQISFGIGTVSFGLLLCSFIFLMREYSVQTMWDQLSARQ